jgi:hypothetical protein
MSGERVGQGRVYVHLGRVKRLSFSAWCEGLAKGRSYVSDGFAHALAFTVNNVAPGLGALKLTEPAKVRIRAKVAFAPKTPRTQPQGTHCSARWQTFIGDTVTFTVRARMK